MRNIQSQLTAQRENPKWEQQRTDDIKIKLVSGGNLRDFDVFNLLSTDINLTVRALAYFVSFCASFVFVFVIYFV